MTEPYSDDATFMGDLAAEDSWMNEVFSGPGYINDIRAHRREETLADTVEDDMHELSRYPMPSKEVTRDGQIRNVEDRLRTPREWCEITGITVLDPDGWRHSVLVDTDAHGFDYVLSPRDFTEEISKDEFDARVSESTCQFPSLRKKSGPND